MQFTGLRVLQVALIAALPLLSPAIAAATTCSTVAACVLGSNIGPGVGVEALSQNSIGLLAASKNGHGVEGRSTKSFGVLGRSTASDGIVGVTNAGGLDGFAGVLGIDRGFEESNSGVLGVSNYGQGIFGTSQIGNGVQGFSVEGEGVVGEGGSLGGLFSGDVSLEVDSSGGSEPSFEMYDDSFPTLDRPLSSGAKLLLSADEGDQTVATIDILGNESLAGTLTQNSSTLVRTKNASGIDVTSFGARSASPTIEDFGSATLRNGVAFVSLERTFASSIDGRNPYMVFITPHGDSNGLYTVLGPAAFTVRENKGGRSTLSFDYRIVAKPLDAKTAHLPAMAPIKKSVFPKVHLPRMPAPNMVLPNVL